MRFAARTRIRSLASLNRLMKTIAMSPLRDSSQIMNRQQFFVFTKALHFKAQGKRRSRATLGFDYLKSGMRDRDDANTMRVFQPGWKRDLF